jgi:hypothetical protein
MKKLNGKRILLLRLGNKKDIEDGPFRQQNGESLPDSLPQRLSVLLLFERGQVFFKQKIGMKDFLRAFACRLDPQLDQLLGIRRCRDTADEKLKQRSV